ncbi:hypothetical protein BGZ83_002882 [Gryganskiella cystojenkinii]|nr:hypothetical protein BGZ83_002882 [Gryganskiella cystojenkinii]
MSVALSFTSPATSPVDSTFSAVSTNSTVYTGAPFRKNSRLYPTTTIAELVIAEAHYLSTLKRVGNALNLASNHSLAAGRKASNTIRALVERWTVMMRIHIKFHDLLVLEPVLADHGRDLSSAVFKLSRNDRQSGHTPAEWDTALRHPFDHLTVYNEWLQRIDPIGNFTGPCLAQLNQLVLNVKTAIEANQNPRGMLKRISTFARGVIKRPSSMQLLQAQQTTENSNTTSVSPTSTTMSGPSTSSATAVNTPSTATEFNYTSSTKNLATTAAGNGSNIKTGINTLRIETVADQAPTLPELIPTSALDNKSLTLESSSSYSSSSRVPDRHSNRTSFAASDISSVGSMTLASSSESLHIKANTIAGTGSNIQSSGSSIAGSTRPTTLGSRQGSSISAASEKQKFLEEREARKATLRMGAQAFITAKAASLQHQPSPTFVSRPEIDRLRTITKRETSTKPPVKSLISFWEQATEPEVEV